MYFDWFGYLIVFILKVFEKFKTTLFLFLWLKVASFTVFCTFVLKATSREPETELKKG